MNARNAALKTLVRITDEQAFSNLEINRVIRDGEIERAQKNLYVNLVYGTLQHQITIDTILRQYIRRGFNRLKPAVRCALRLAVYQILYLNQAEHAVVNEAVKQVKKADARQAGLVNGVLRNILRDKARIQTEIAQNPDLSVRYSIPEWIIARYKESFGDKTEAVLKCLNEQPPLTLRVKPEQYADVFKRLKAAGAQPKPSGIDGLENTAIRVGAPDALGTSIEQSALYRDGLISIQDQGAMAIDAALAPKPGEEVLDLCAAPGGKTTHLAEMMEGTGSVTACDIYPSRVALIKSAAKRLGLSNIHVCENDAAIFNPEFENKFDAVLVDAPCSGLGIIRRKPDIRYRVQEEDTEALAALQQDILENAARYVKDGGRLVYSTCTVGRQENEVVVTEFLKNQPFVLRAQKHTSPLESGADCFYYAVLEKE